jgi:hypothetical protein
MDIYREIFREKGGASVMGIVCFWLQHTIHYNSELAAFTSRAVGLRNRLTKRLSVSETDKQKGYQS